MTKVKDKKKLIKMNFMPMLDFQFDNLLEFIEAFGFDLDSFDENDTTYTDIKNALNQIEEATPSVDISVKDPNNGSQYMNYYFTKTLKDSPNIGGAKEAPAAPEAPAEESKQEAPKAPTPPPAPKAPEAPEPPKAPEAPKTTADGLTLQDLVDNGWTEEQALSHYPELA